MAKPAPTVELTFNVETDSYVTFISNLRGKLAGTAGKNVDGHAVLDVQTDEDKQPPRWINVVLRGGGAVAPKVAIRSDNAYVVGFTNSAGKWFQFNNAKKTPILPSATLLGFTGHYSDLIGRPDVNLPKLQLSRSTTSGAVAELWKHGQKTLTAELDADADAADDGGDSSTLELAATAADPLQKLKKALATLAVTLCEAARLIPVYSTVNGGWAAGATVTAAQVKYINKWGQLSEALLGWNVDRNDDKWFKFLKESTGISTGKQALTVVQLLLNNPPKVKKIEHAIGASVEEEEAPAE